MWKLLGSQALGELRHTCGFAGSQREGTPSSSKSSPYATLASFHHIQKCKLLLFLTTYHSHAPLTSDKPEDDLCSQVSCATEGLDAAQSLGRTLVKVQEEMTFQSFSFLALHEHEEILENAEKHKAIDFKKNMIIPQLRKINDNYGNVSFYKDI